MYFYFLIIPNTATENKDAYLYHRINTYTTKSVYAIYANLQSVHDFIVLVNAVFKCHRLPTNSTFWPPLLTYFRTLIFVLKISTTCMSHELEISAIVIFSLIIHRILTRLYIVRILYIIISGKITTKNIAEVLYFMRQTLMQRY